MEARRIANIALWVVQSFTLLSAVGGGIGLIATNGLGMPLSLLDASPFDSYLLPGLILLCVVGGTQALAVATHYLRSRWLPAAATVAGFGMVIWICVEVVILPGYHWLHTLYFTTGSLQLALVLVLLGVLPRARHAVA